MKDIAYLKGGELKRKQIMLEPREGEILRNALVNGKIIDEAIVVWDSESNEFMVCEYYTVITSVPDSGDIDNYNINEGVPFNEAITMGSFYDIDF